MSQQFNPTGSRWPWQYPPQNGNPPLLDSQPTAPSLKPSSSCERSFRETIAPGMRVGRYLIEEPLARGGMGFVLKAFDLEMERRVALKVLNDSLASNPDLRQRFVNEAKITGRLEHPSIPPVYELSVWGDGRPFLAMKLIQGRTLSELLTSRAGSSDELPKFLNIYLKICEGLAHAHRRGILHRDLKPSNIMVGDFGEVQVMDWGLAKDLNEWSRRRVRRARELTKSTLLDVAMMVDSSPESWEGMGTPAYMAPEQADGDPHHLTPAADVFGLGGLLCVILTGRPPYVAASRAELLRKAAMADLDDAFALLEQAPVEPQWKDLCRRCLDPQPLKRPANAVEVAQLVSSLLDETEARARRAELDAAVQMTQLAEERKRRRIGFLLALAILVGGFVGLEWLRQRQAQRETTWTTLQNRLIQAEEARQRRLWNLGLNELAEAQLLALSLEDHSVIDQVQHLAEQLTLERDLEEIRLDRAQWGPEGFPKVEDRYAERLRRIGFDLVNPDDTVLAQILRTAPSFPRLSDALDDWIVEASRDEVRTRLLRIQHLATGESAYFRLAELDWSSKISLQALYRILEEIPPDKLGLIQLIAYALDRAGGDATRVLEQAILRHPEEFWLHLHLGNILSRDQPRTDSLERAVRAFGTARAIRPDNFAAINNLALALRRLKRFDEALILHRKALQISPDLALGRLNLATCLSELGHHAEAENLLRSALSLEPDHTLLLHSLSRVLFHQKRSAEALEIARREAELQPSSWRPLLLQSHLLREMGQDDEALTVTERAARLAPLETDVQLELARIFAKRQELDRAVHHLQCALATEPISPRLHLDSRAILESIHRVEEAVEHQRIMVALEPDSWENLADLAAMLKKLDPGMKVFGAEIEAVLLRATQLAPRQRRPYLMLASFSTQARKHAQALEMFEKALALDPDDLETRSDLAITLVMLGRRSEAMAIWHQLSEQAPDDFRFHANLGAALAEEGQVDQAIVAIERAIQAFDRAGDSPNARPTQFPRDVARANLTKMLQALRARRQP